MRNGRVKFVTPKGNRFNDTLRARVDDYFEANHLSRHWNWTMAVKTVICLGTWCLSYAAVMSNHFAPWGMLAWCCLIGAAAAGIGFNVAHDASHGGYSINPRTNRIFAHAFTLLGVSEFYWHISHNVIHHSFPNIPNADADLHPPPVLRYFDCALEKRWYHPYQHIYAYALYSLASLSWVVFKDYNHVTNGIHDSYPKPKVSIAQYVILVAGKAFHCTAFLVLPLLFVHAAAWRILLGFVVMHLVTGTLLAVVFAVGHLVDDTAIIYPGSDGVIHDSWYAHQLRTTANFSTNSYLVNLTLGGLNFQIEHHLFPRICHVHYKKLAPIVRATAAEFGIPYVEYKSFLLAQKAHRRFLRRYGGAAVVAQPVLLSGDHLPTPLGSGDPAA